MVPGMGEEGGDILLNQYRVARVSVCTIMGKGGMLYSSKVRRMWLRKLCVRCCCCCCCCGVLWLQTDAVSPLQWQTLLLWLLLLLASFSFFVSWHRCRVAVGGGGVRGHRLFRHVGVGVGVLSSVVAVVVFLVGLVHAAGGVRGCCCCCRGCPGPGRGPSPRGRRQEGQTLHFVDHYNGMH